MLVLVLGDIHIPHRAPEIPEKFKNMLAKAREDKRIGTILCTGNLVDKSMLDYLRTFCHDVKVVAGEFDETKLPEQEVVTIGAFKIGLIHGHQIVPWGDSESLAMFQRKLDCDILISGSTHKFKAEEVDGKYFINPGSITGAFSGTDPDPTPSFVLMDISGDTVTNYIYQLKGGEMKVIKRDFKKSS